MSKYGEEKFDLVIASSVIHWLKHQQKCELFQNASHCLKPNEQFIFSALSENKTTTWPLVTLIGELGNEIIQMVQCEPKHYYEKLIVNNGFLNAFSGSYHNIASFECLQDLLKWFTATFHTRKHDKILTRLQRAFEKANINFLFNQKGVPFDDAELYHIKCVKK